MNYRKDQKFATDKNLVQCCLFRNLQQNRNGIENHFAHPNFPWKWDIRFESTRIKSPKYIGNLERSKVRHFVSNLNRYTSCCRMSENEHRKNLKGDRWLQVS